MVTNGHDPTPRFLQIKQDDKFFSKLLSKEETSNKNESSFRLSYYNGVASASIPFTWESQPGTPKHTLFSDTTLPPLTPPPSYLSPAWTTNRAAACHKRSKSSFRTLFPRMGTSKKSKNVSPSASYSSSSSSLSSSYSTSPSSTPVKLIPRSRSTIGFGIDEDEDEDEEEQLKNKVRSNSALCFGARFGGRRRFRSSGHCHYPMKNWRRAFLSIAGGGTA